MSQSSDTLLVQLENGVRVIKFNNTKKKNAVSRDDFLRIFVILQEDSKNDDVVVTIVSGSGDYFTSGILLNPDLLQDINAGVDGIATFINYPKLLIAVVNGPAIGFGVCFLPLFDIVYASDRATFYTPFLKMGLTPDFCASYIFPRLMGKSLASEVMLLGRVLTAKEALDAHLVSTVVPHTELDILMTKLLKLGNLSINWLQQFKQLINKQLKQLLIDVNKDEMQIFRNLLDEANGKTANNYNKKSKL